MEFIFFSLNLEIWEEKQGGSFVLVIKKLFIILIKFIAVTLVNKII